MSGLIAMIPFFFNFQKIMFLERYSVFEYRYFTIVVDLVTGFFATCHCYDLVDEFRKELVHGLSLHELSGTEVYPVWLS